MNLEVEVNIEVETIEVLKISLSDNKSSHIKSMYLALNNDQLIRLVEKQSIEVKGVETVVIKESQSKSVEINNVKNITIPIKVNLDKEKMKEVFIKFVERNKKENTTTDGSDELKVCSNCGVQAERKGAKFCFHCGTKFL